jgi:hypothetical protein
MAFGLYSGKNRAIFATCQAIENIDLINNLASNCIFYLASCQVSCKLSWQWKPLRQYPTPPLAEEGLQESSFARFKIRLKCFQI